MGMREATAAEYAAVYSRHGYMDVSRTSGKRYFSAVSKDRGTEVCARHEILSRGKVVSTMYMVDPAFLPSTQSIALVVGREAFDGDTLVRIEAFEPFGPALCDVRVRAGARVCWTSLHTLRPADGVRFPVRREVCQARERESAAQLARIADGARS